jgi:hypothetical protein
MNELYEFSLGQIYPPYLGRTLCAREQRESILLIRGISQGFPQQPFGRRKVPGPMDVHVSAVNKILKENIADPVTRPEAWQLHCSLS